MCTKGSLQEMYQFHLRMKEISEFTIVRGATARTFYQDYQRDPLGASPKVLTVVIVHLIDHFNFHIL